MSLRYFEGARLAAAYARRRPVPPPSLVANLINYIKEKHQGPLQTAVDIGCGTGQVTRELAPHFPKVIGVDISPAQIETAKATENPTNVEYHLLEGDSSYPGSVNSTSLVTTCMTAHWLDMPNFFQQADRLLHPGGVIAIFGYPVPELLWPGKTKLLNQILEDVYFKDFNDFFGKVERDDIYKKYTAPKYTIPYEECCREEGHICDLVVTVDEVLDYVTTISGYSGYVHHHGQQQADQLLLNVKERIAGIIGPGNVGPSTRLPMRFPFFVSCGRKPITAA